MKEIKKKDKKEHIVWAEYLILLMQVGLTVVGSILFCFAIGYYLDKWLNTKPIFTAIFIILGIIGGGYTAYRQITQIEEDGKR